MAILHLDLMRKRKTSLLPVECSCGLITLTKIYTHLDYPIFECSCGNTIDIDEELEILAFGAECLKKEKATG